MTISYSLNVSRATFLGFLKLLFRWKGSIYKSMWREGLIFCLLFFAIQLLLRHAPISTEKSVIWMAIKFVDSVGEDVPYSFVLGFYVSFVASRWMTQFSNIPWPDRLCHMIGAYVHGSDERSRIIRRTLARYAILLQALTYQTVSTSVKKRFPKSRHLVEAGLMSPEEMAVYEKIEFSYGKWWLPCHWFTTLAVRAKKEGRIKDSILLKALLEESINYRTMCALTIAYDWISVPLAYTQVATITAYFKALTLLIGKQTLDMPDMENTFAVDFYFPFVTMYRFLWTVGWLKVAQQILNPYGEDDDDFELNWTLDRGIQLAYDIVDHYHSMHPRLTKDVFWDTHDIKLPQTEHSAKYMRNPDLGSAFKLDIENVEYLPMEELCEQDKEENVYQSHSVRKKDAVRQRSSIMKRVFHSGQSIRKTSKKGVQRSLSAQQGFDNPTFSMKDEDTSSINSMPLDTRNSGITGLVKKISPKDRNSRLKRNTCLMKKHRSSEDGEQSGGIADLSSRGNERADERHNSLKLRWSDTSTAGDWNQSLDDFEPNSEENDQGILMPAIPEEMLRENSLSSHDLKNAALRGERFSQQVDRAYDIVKEASEVLQEISESASAQGRQKTTGAKGYQSCCSTTDSEETPDCSCDEIETAAEEAVIDDVVLNIDPNSNKKVAAVKPPATI